MLLKKPRTRPSWASYSLCWFHHRNSNPPELYKNDKQVQADHGQGCAPKDVEQRPPAKPALDLLFLLPRNQKCGFALALDDEVAVVLVFGVRVLSAGSGNRVGPAGNNAILRKTKPSQGCTDAAQTDGPLEGPDCALEGEDLTAGHVVSQLLLSRF